MLMHEQEGADDRCDIPTDPTLDQHFLTNPAKLELFIEAAAIQPTDDVVEVGAGIGTVAEHVPTCRSLTAVEYDGTLTPYLRQRVPQARVLQGDALALLPGLRCDVLLSNLPSSLTPALAELLSTLDFRVLVVTVPTIKQLEPLREAFTLELVTVLVEDDFQPRQAVKAEVVKVCHLPGRRTSPAGGASPMRAGQPAPR